MAQITRQGGRVGRRVDPNVRVRSRDSFPRDLEKEFPDMYI
jgi:hypothetical protein